MDGQDALARDPRAKKLSKCLRHRRTTGAGQPVPLRVLENAWGWPSAEEPTQAEGEPPRDVPLNVAAQLDDDFGGFGSASKPAQVDSVDDFLARERALLGEDANAFGSAPPAEPADDLLSPGPERSTSGARFDVSNLERDDSDVEEVQRPPRQQNVSVTAHDDVSAFEQQFPQVEVEPAAQPSLTPKHQNGNGYGASPYNQPAPSFSQPATIEPESDATRAWREKQQAEIKKRDDEAQAKREETIARAEKAIDDFYNEYNAKKEKQIAKNKEEEANFLNARNDALAQGTTWQRIADLIDLQDSRSKTNTRSTKDLSRFKELLLALKREGETAPGAAGY